MLTDKINNNQNHYNGSIFHDGLKFHRKYIGKKSCTYWCANNRSKDSICTAKIKIDPFGKMQIVGKHDNLCYLKHESSRKALGLLKAEDKENIVPDVTQKMLERAEELELENLSEKPKKIHLQILRETEMKHPIFKGASSCKIINRIKNARTKINGNDVFRTIEMEHLSKMKDSNNFFLQFNITFPNEYDGKLERIIGYGNPSLFRVFGGNQKVFIDGTFKICPKPFYQCLIIMVFDEQTDAYVPVFYVLLTSKTEQIYRHVLYWVKTTTQYKMRPLTITCNFEKALHNAISVEFPTAIINGCLFHWKQAIRRKILDLKFDEPVVDRFMNPIALQTLTIIPPNEIMKYGIPFVRDIVDHELSKKDMDKIEIFWQYFYKFWMSSPSFIYRWNVNHHPREEKKNCFVRTMVSKDIIEH